MTDQLAADAPVYAAAFADQAVSLGQQGFSRAEIASQLGVSLQGLEAWSQADGAFAAALQRADTEARAWWDRQPREAMAGGVAFRAQAWSKAMAQRYGSQSHRPSRDAKAPAEKRVLARYEIPDNGKSRRPDRG